MSKVRSFTKFTVAGMTTAVLGATVHGAWTSEPSLASRKQIAIGASAVAAIVWSCTLL